MTTHVRISNLEDSSPEKELLIVSSEASGPPETRVGPGADVEMHITDLSEVTMTEVPKGQPRAGDVVEDHDEGDDED